MSGRGLRTTSIEGWNRSARILSLAVIVTLVGATIAAIVVEAERRAVAFRLQLEPISKTLALLQTESSLKELKKEATTLSAQQPHAATLRADLTTLTAKWPAKPDPGEWEDLVDFHWGAWSQPSPTLGELQLSEHRIRFAKIPVDEILAIDRLSVNDPTKIEGSITETCFALVATIPGHVKEIPDAGSYGSIDLSILPKKTDHRVKLQFSSANGKMLIAVPDYEDALRKMIGEGFDSAPISMNPLSTMAKPVADALKGLSMAEAGDRAFNAFLFQAPSLGRWRNGIITLAILGVVAALLGYTLARRAVLPFVDEIERTTTPTPWLLLTAVLAGTGATALAVFSSGDAEQRNTALWIYAGLFTIGIGWLVRDHLSLRRMCKELQ